MKQLVLGSWNAATSCTVHTEWTRWRLQRSLARHPAPQLLPVTHNARKGRPRYEPVACFGKWMMVTPAVDPTTCGAVRRWATGTQGLVHLAMCVLPRSHCSCMGWLGRTPVAAQLKEDRDDLSSLVSRRPPMPASVYDPSLPISTSVRTSLVLCSFRTAYLTCALRTHARIHALAGGR